MSGHGGAMKQKLMILHTTIILLFAVRNGHCCFPNTNILEILETILPPQIETTTTTTTTTTQAQR